MKTDAAQDVQPISTTLGEILVKPQEASDETLARRYEQAITAAATVIPFDRTAAYAFAGVRRDRTIRPGLRRSTRRAPLFSG